MEQSAFDYTIYIAATPERVWNALTNGDATKEYFFGRRIESDWKVGSPWKLVMEDGRTDSDGHVLESDRPRKLSMTWRVEWLEEFRKLPEAVITYQLEPSGEVVRLTMSQQQPKVDEKYLEGPRKGWPAVLSGLKTLVETGHRMPAIPMEAPQ